LLFKSINIKINGTIILPVVLCGCGTSPHTLKEERRPRVMRKMFGPKAEEETADWRNLHSKDAFNVYTLIKSSRMSWARSCDMQWEMCTGFWWGNLKKRGHLEDIGVSGKKILQESLKKQDGRVLTGFIWIRLGTTGRLV
jgi:hypothetical protein